MKITLIMVTSLDGKLTKGNNPDTPVWNSKEDQELFLKAHDSHNLLVMGRRTFEPAYKNMVLTPQKRRIVLTRNPQDFKEYEVTGQLEFTNENPSDLVKRLESEGHTQMLLLGGGEIANKFYKEKLINELLLTLEPKIFGAGQFMAGSEEIDVTFRLEECKRLNEQGTLSLRYTAIY